MKLPVWIVLLIYLTCWPAAVFSAPMITAQNGDYLILRDKPCDDPQIQAHIVANGAGRLLDQFKQSDLYWQGKSYKSCYVEVEGWVYAIDENGEKLKPLPRVAFEDKTI